MAKLSERLRTEHTLDEVINILEQALADMTKRAEEAEAMCEWLANFEAQRYRVMGEDRGLDKEEVAARVKLQIAIARKQATTKEGHDG